MFGILARLLEFLYSLWPSYGGSIILFTLAIMLVLAPLTFKSTRSMLAMQALQPEMKKLQNRYKDDRQKLNEEMMKFYQENKISPLGGCLPMIIQFPVFFILYAVLLGLTKRGPFGEDLGYSVACSMGGVGDACTSIGTYANAGFFHPAYLKETSDLYQSLSSTRVMSSFGLDLSQSAWNEFAHGLLHALPYVIMVLVVMGLTYLQQQQIQRRQPKNADQNPTQQMLMKVMPIAMGFIYIIIPAGVVIYFLVSSIFRIGQQAMVTRTFYTGPNAIAIPATAVEVDGGSGGFLDRLKGSGGVLPKVGKEAKRERHASFEPAGSGARTTSTRPKSGGSGSGPSRASGSKKAGSKKAGSGGGKAKSSAGTAKSGGRKAAGGGQQKTRPEGGRTSGTAGSGSAKRKRPDRPSSGSGGQKKSARPDRSAPSRKAPSRQAPSRKSPRGPSGSDA